MRMRGVVVVVGSVLLVGALSGGSAVAETPAAVGRYSTPAATVAMTPAQTYVTTIRGLIADMPHAEQSDADLVRGGRDLCAEIKGGATWRTFTDQMSQYDVDRNLARATIYAAVNAFCPENAGILR